MLGKCATLSYTLSPWVFKPRSSYLAQAVLKLTILLPQPPECWDYSLHYHAQHLTGIFFKEPNEVSRNKKLQLLK
jgi:hypothetical protein